MSPFSYHFFCFNDANMHFQRKFLLDITDYCDMRCCRRNNIICICCARYHLKGIKAGHAEIFVENLPCFPDNIRPSSAGGYWLAGGVMRYEGKFSALDFLGPRPWIRWIISKVSRSFFLLRL